MRIYLGNYIDKSKAICYCEIIGNISTQLSCEVLSYPIISRRLPIFDFQRSFNVTYTENHYSNLLKAVDHFEKVIFPYLEKIKIRKGYPKEQISLIIMDTFKGQDNDDFQIVIVPHNLPNKFQPLDLTVNKAAKSFISEKYNAWLANEVAKQLKEGNAPSDVKVTLQLTVIKPKHAGWIVELYHKLQNEKEKIVNSNSRKPVAKEIV